MIKYSERKPEKYVWSGLIYDFTLLNILYRYEHQTAEIDLDLTSITTIIKRHAINQWDAFSLLDYPIKCALNQSKAIA